MTSTFNRSSKSSSETSNDNKNENLNQIVANQNDKERLRDTYFQETIDIPEDYDVSFLSDYQFENLFFNSNFYFTYSIRSVGESSGRSLALGF